jgi:hypothetical protein
METLVRKTFGKNMISMFMGFLMLASSVAQADPWWVRHDRTYTVHTTSYSFNWNQLANNVRDFNRRLGQGIQQAAVNVGNAIGTGIQNLANGVATVGNAIGTGIRNLFTPVRVQISVTRIPRHGSHCN